MHFKEQFKSWQLWTIDQISFIVESPSQNKVSKNVMNFIRLTINMWSKYKIIIYHTMLINALFINKFSNIYYLFIYNLYWSSNLLKVTLYFQICTYIICIQNFKILSLLGKMIVYIFWIFRHIKRIFSIFSTLQNLINLCWIWH
jgi:hypothetical protein